MTPHVSPDDLVGAGATADDFDRLPRVDPGMDLLPRINAARGNLPIITGEAWNALLIANTPPVLFRHAGLLAWIEQDDDGTPMIRALTQDRLRYRSQKTRLGKLLAEMRDRQFDGYRITRAGHDFEGMTNENQ